MSEACRATISTVVQGGGMTDRIRVAVVFGGRSGEHQVSCISAAGVLANIDTDLFDVTAIGITPAGRWLHMDPAAIPAAGGKELPTVTAGSVVALPADPTAAAMVSIDPLKDRTAAFDVDVVFPVLHGPYGEDGTIQGLLELAGVPYVGAGVLASAAAMDKEFAKKLLAAEGLPVGDWVVLRPGTATLTAEQKERLGLPVFVKPARAGSSLGVSRVDDWADLDARHRPRPADRPEGAGRGGRRRPGDRVRGARVPGRPDRGFADRGDPCRRRARVLRLRRQVPRRRRPASTSPPTCRPR